MAILKDKTNGKFVRNLKDKECLDCKKVFHPRFEKIKFCSKKCDSHFRTKEHNRPCKQCSKSFYARNMKTRFCSHKCYGKSGVGARKGELNTNWKGGITRTSVAIRNSTEYKLWRKSVFERDDYTCVWCGNNESGNLNADHIKSFAQYPELRFAIDNGRTLCIPCHKTTDSYLNIKYKKNGIQYK